MIERFRPEHFQRNLIRGAVIPSGQRKSREVGDMVIVVMGCEEMRDVTCAVSAFNEPLMNACAVIEDYQVIADFGDVTGAESLSEGAGVPLPSIRNFMSFAPLR